MNLSVNTQEFLSLAASQTLNVIDLRDPEFYDTTELKGFTDVTQLPLTQLVNQFDQLDKNKTYYLFSQFGDHSGTMAQFLREKGYKVVKVIGGATAFSSYLAS